MTRSGRKGNGAERGRPLKSRATLLQQTLTAIRLEADLTQAEMAKLMYTDQATIAKWENGVRYPSLTTLEKIAEVTGKRLEVRFV